MSRGKYKKRKLEKVMEFEPILDIQGRFIPFCIYEPHRGIPKSYKNCEQRKCRHYRKLYLYRSFKI